MESLETRCVRTGWVRLSADDERTLADCRVADTYSAISIACILDTADERMFGFPGDYDEDEFPTPARRWSPSLLLTRLRAAMVGEGQ
jgi:hypothetical protein